MTEEAKELIKYRISKSYTVFKEAKALFDLNLLFGTTNRLYYSCFYAVLALLILQNLNSKTHKGVMHLFYKNFIEKGIVDKKWNNLYHRIFDLRNEGDYMDDVEIEIEEVRELISEVKEFIDAINDYITKEIGRIDSNIVETVR